MIKLVDLLTEASIKNIIQEYIEWSKYDILNSWGSCSFYTQDFLDTIFKRHHFAAVIAYFIAFLFLIVTTLEP